MDAFPSMEMINVNKCYAPGQTTVTYYSCLTNLLDESFFLKYLQFVTMFSGLVIFITLQFFIIPLSILFYIYFSSLFLMIYQRTHKLKEDYCSNTWDVPRLIIFYLWDLIGRFWHGYELHGTENLPDGPGLVIYYHGAIPVDYLYFLARLFVLKHRLCHSIADEYVFRFPGVKTLVDVMCITHPTKEECLNILKNGHLLGISPGGAREALFSDESYKLVWCKRKGFAQVAIDAKVPIIPMYTQNVREGFRVFGKSSLAKWIYEHVRVPFLPPYGGFPVKLRTFLGEPIPYDPNITAAELAVKTKSALQSLIQSHQKIPGSICSALMERFHR